MIRITRTSHQSALIEWQTGTDYTYLQLIEALIILRNEDKEHIKQLQEKQ